MAQTRDLQSVVDAAEQAAAAGDYETAEQHLREAARLQEARLGPLHPDLANTLNNLGIVCEISNNPSAAEQFFRRAYTIAIASLPADHPFVETSRKNLEDFCRAQGKPIDLPAPPLTPPPEPAPPIVAVAEPPPEPPKDIGVSALPQHDLVESPQVARSERVHTPSIESARTSPMIMGGGALIVVVVLVAGYLIMSSRSRPDAVPASTNVVTLPATAPPSSPPVESKPAPAAPSTTPAAPTRTEPSSKPAAAAPAPTKPSSKEERRNGKSGVAPSPTLVEARLCRTLATGAGWHCAAPEQPVHPGQVYFYNRLKAPTDTAVEHRWYSGGRLRRVVELRIRANPNEGYRTYSRNTVDSRNGSDWRVELRAKDGTILHEERFTVR